MIIKMQLCLISCLFGLCVIASLSGSSSATKNVLLIIVDDLRPEIGVYSQLVADDPLYDSIYTPSIDKLAKQSVKFTKAFSQYPTCGPSRASFLTGRRPDSLKVYRNVDDFRSENDTKDIVTMPQYFKQNSYNSYGFGKVFHEGHEDNENSWSEDVFASDRSTIAYWDSRTFNDASWGAAPDADLAADPLTDLEIFDHTNKKLQNVSKTGEKFFMAVGFKKPHLPFVCPESYYNMYQPFNLELPADEYKYTPKDMPQIAWSDWLDLQTASDIDGVFSHNYNESVDDAKILELRRGYYSCVTFIDNLIGQLLDTLKTEGLEDNTVVALISDHGFHLGEHSEWTKGTLFQLDLNVPWMLKVPGETDTRKRRGYTSTRFVENVDIFPTLVEAAGLPPLEYCTKTTSDACHEGMSAYRFVADQKANGKKWVLSQYLRNNGTDNFMGYSISTKGYHYIRWVSHNVRLDKSDMDDVHAEELYKFKRSGADPFETVNKAGDSAYKSAVRKMYRKLKKGWEGALPKDA